MASSVDYCEFLRPIETNPSRSAQEDIDKSVRQTGGPLNGVLMCEYLKENIPHKSSCSWERETERRKTCASSVSGRSSKSVCDVLDRSKAIFETLEKNKSIQEPSRPASSRNSGDRGVSSARFTRPVCLYLKMAREVVVPFSPAPDKRVERRCTSLESSTNTNPDSIKMVNGISAAIPASASGLKFKDEKQFVLSVATIDEQQGKSDFSADSTKVVASPGKPVLEKEKPKSHQDYTNPLLQIESRQKKLNSNTESPLRRDEDQTENQQVISTPSERYAQTGKRKEAAGRFSDSVNESSGEDKIGSTSPGCVTHQQSDAKIRFTATNIPLFKTQDTATSNSLSHKCQFLLNTHREDTNSNTAGPTCKFLSNTNSNSSATTSSTPTCKFVATPRGITGSNISTNNSTNTSPEVRFLANTNRDTGTSNSLSHKCQFLLNTHREDTNSNTTSPKCKFLSNTKSEDNNSNTAMNPTCKFLSNTKREDSNSTTTNPTCKFLSKTKREDINSNTTSPTCKFLSITKREDSNSNTTSPTCKFLSNTKREDINSNTTSPTCKFLSNTKREDINSNTTSPTCKFLSNTKREDSNSNTAGPTNSNIAGPTCKFLSNTQREDTNSNTAGPTSKFLSNTNSNSSATTSSTPTCKFVATPRGITGSNISTNNSTNTSPEVRFLANTNRDTGTSNSLSHKCQFLLNTHREDTNSKITSPTCKFLSNTKSEDNNSNTAMNPTCKFLSNTKREDSNSTTTNPTCKFLSKTKREDSNSTTTIPTCKFLSNSKREDSNSNTAGPTNSDTAGPTCKFLSNTQREDTNSNTAGPTCKFLSNTNSNSSASTSSTPTCKFVATTRGITGSNISTNNSTNTSPEVRFLANAKRDTGAITSTGHKCHFLSKTTTPDQRSNFNNFTCQILTNNNGNTNIGDVTKTENTKQTTNTIKAEEPKVTNDETSREHQFLRNISPHYDSTNNERSSTTTTNTPCSYINSKNSNTTAPINVTCGSINSNRNNLVTPSNVTCGYINSHRSNSAVNLNATCESPSRSKPDSAPPLGLTSKHSHFSTITQPVCGYLKREVNVSDKANTHTTPADTQDTQTYIPTASLVYQAHDKTISKFPMNPSDGRSSVGTKKLSLSSENKKNLLYRYEKVHPNISWTSTQFPRKNTTEESSSDNRFLASHIRQGAFLRQVTLDLKRISGHTKELETSELKAEVGAGKFVSRENEDEEVRNVKSVVWSAGVPGDWFTGSSSQHSFRTDGGSSSQHRSNTDEALQKTHDSESRRSLHNLTSSPVTLTQREDAENSTLNSSPRKSSQPAPFCKYLKSKDELPDMSTDMSCAYLAKHRGTQSTLGLSLENNIGFIRKQVTAPLGEKNKEQARGSYHGFELKINMSSQRELSATAEGTRPLCTYVEKCRDVGALLSRVDKGPSASSRGKMDGLTFNKENESETLICNYGVMEDKVNVSCKENERLAPTTSSSHGNECKNTATTEAASMPSPQHSHVNYCKMDNSKPNSNELLKSVNENPRKSLNSNRNLFKNLTHNTLSIGLRGNSPKDLESQYFSLDNLPVCVKKYSNNRSLSACGSVVNGEKFLFKASPLSVVDVNQSQTSVANKTSAEVLPRHSLLGAEMSSETMTKGPLGYSGKEDGSSRTSSLSRSKNISGNNTLSKNNSLSLTNTISKTNTPSRVCTLSRSSTLSENSTMSRTSTMSGISTSTSQCLAQYEDDEEFSDSSGSEALEKYDRNLAVSISPVPDSFRANDLDLVPPPSSCQDAGDGALTFGDVQTGAVSQHDIEIFASSPTETPERRTDNINELKRARKLRRESVVLDLESCNVSMELAERRPRSSNPGCSPLGTPHAKHVETEKEKFPVSEVRDFSAPIIHRCDFLLKRKDQSDMLSINLRTPSLASNFPSKEFLSSNKINTSEFSAFVSKNLTASERQNPLHNKNNIRTSMNALKGDPRAQGYDRTQESLTNSETHLSTGQQEDTSFSKSKSDHDSSAAHVTGSVPRELPKVQRSCTFLLKVQELLRNLPTSEPLPKLPITEPQHNLPTSEPQHILPTSEPLT
ncbi:streptococcal hemagglutinin-like [Cherax quadricarinatus]|uniref:streptococcal hemagglutinin-like n=1 Tax=Cherax quadricarinatus TaxID=27406 RepID=UPI00387EB5DF